jgi:hypothetical protein
MSERGLHLLEMAQGQITGLIDLLCAGGDGVLGMPCPGREKLGDGTVAACASHTADRYKLIAEFLQTVGKMPAANAAKKRAPHRIPRLPLARAHGPGSHAQGEHEQRRHDGDYTDQSVDLDDLLERLSASRDALVLLAELTDERLDTVPPAGSFRFCDGQRTLEQVVAGLLKHQGHQVDAIRATVA